MTKDPEEDVMQVVSILDPRTLRVRVTEPAYSLSSKADGGRIEGIRITTNAELLAELAELDPAW